MAGQLALNQQIEVRPLAPELRDRLIGRTVGFEPTNLGSTPGLETAVDDKWLISRL